MIDNQQNEKLKITKAKLGKNIQREYMTDEKIMEKLEKINWYRKRNQFYITSNIERISADDPQFDSNYEKLNIPVILQGISNQWDVEKYWKLNNFKELYDCEFKIGEDDDALPIKIRIDNFFEYMQTNKDENPLYIFDRYDFKFDVSDLTKISREGKPLYNYYQVPENFKEDFLQLLGDQRPQFRWLLIGPKRSGSLMHIDPYQSSAWNTSLEGRKKWILFPPEIDKKTALGLNLIQDKVISADDCSSPVSFFFNVLPQILEQPSLKNNKQVIQCIQYPGETMFVPRGWWHAVLNLDDTLAVTQNYINQVNFKFSWRAFRQENPFLASKLLKKLSESNELIYNEAIKMNQDDNYKMLVEIDELQEDDNNSNQSFDLPAFDNSSFQQSLNDII